MSKIVEIIFNNCHGGFGLKDDAINKMKHNFPSMLFLKSDFHTYCDKIYFRMNQQIINFIKQNGIEESQGSHCKLKIAKYEIDTLIFFEQYINQCVVIREYDGLESVGFNIEHLISLVIKDKIFSDIDKLYEWFDKIVDYYPKSL